MTAGVTRPIQYSLARRQSVSGVRVARKNGSARVKSGAGPEGNHRYRSSPHLVTKVLSEPARDCRIAADEAEIGEHFGSRVASAQSGNPRTRSANGPSLETSRPGYDRLTF